MKEKLFAFAIAFFVLTNSYCQKPAIIPQPASVTMPKQAGHFTISPQTKIVVEASDMQNSADFLNNYLQEVYGFKLTITDKHTSNAIVLNSIRLDNPVPGAYELNVKKGEIYVAGEGGNGTFYGIQTLIQLLPTQISKSLSVPFISIADRARFEYRGLHLDCGRHFFTVDYIKRFIDYIALHKMNYFHWHLTEDQGWRIEIKKYPRLTEVGAWRNGTIIGRYPGKGSDNTRYGGFYTQEQVRDVVEYAAKRYITIVPEIEMPGHGSAAIAAYPWLSCFADEPTKIAENMISSETKSRQAKGEKKFVQETWGVFSDVFCAGNDSVYTFLQDVIDEVIQLFPGKYFHVGADECPKENWKRCPKCQKMKKDEGLADEHQLQSYFVQRMEKYINSKGKTMIGWDEILEGGLAQNAVVMSWRGEKGGIEAAQQYHKVIMTPTTYVYLDYSQTKNEDSVTIGSYVPLEKVYNYEPIPKELTAEQAKYIVGAQANVWTEYMSNPRKIEYMIFPRVSALSETVWSQKENKNWNDFERRLIIQFKRFENWKTNYSKAYFDLGSTITTAPGNQSVVWKLTARQKDNISVTSGNGKFNTLQAVPGETRVQILKSGTYAATGKKYPARTTLEFSLNKATGRNIQLTTSPRADAAGEGGAIGLVNGVKSLKGANSSEWLGWQGADMEAIIDLGQLGKITSVNAHVLAARGSQPCKPQYLEAYASPDGKEYTLIGKMTEIIDEPNFMGNLKLSFPEKTTRYVKILVKSFGIIPEGMRGAGNAAWLFVDELQID